MPILYILIGAAAAGIGVIANATADRIRYGCMSRSRSDRASVLSKASATRTHNTDPSKPSEPLTSLRADAVTALTTMGFKSRAAETAVDQARGKLPASATLDVLIREALRCTTKVAA